MQNMYTYTYMYYNQKVKPTGQLSRYIQENFVVGPKKIFVVFKFHLKNLLWELIECLVKTFLISTHMALWRNKKTIIDVRKHQIYPKY